jgi:hypothetical protein
MRRVRYEKCSCPKEPGLARPCWVEPAYMTKKGACVEYIICSECLGLHQSEAYTQAGIHFITPSTFAEALIDGQDS